MRQSRSRSTWIHALLNYRTKYASPCEGYSPARCLAMRRVGRQDRYAECGAGEGRLRSPKAKPNNYVARARRKWPRAIWIVGDGPYASVSRCPPGETVMLFPTMAEAETLKNFIDSTRCCESCRLDHLTVELKINRRR